jgi:ADP-dependent NAD(P)H-hydrate dehydratase / NAD(P)H-hydrate epimerase
MKLFSTQQVRKLDAYTLQNEPISELELMERAASLLTDRLMEVVPYGTNVRIFCGPGNNGGDGLVIARMLSYLPTVYSVQVFILGEEIKRSAAFIANLDRLKVETKLQIVQISSEIDFPTIESDDYVIDALFGAGLKRPLSGMPAELVRHINSVRAHVIAVDIPSGLQGENNSTENYSNCICAQQTFTFQFPKLAFFFQENHKYIGDWEVLDVCLHPQALADTPTPYNFFEQSDATKFLKPRSKFAHKGNFGHGLLIAGSYGMIGAAILGARACLRSGVGLVSVHVPQKGYQIIQTSVPEAMLEIDDSELMFTSISNSNRFSAIAVGPGLGTKLNTQRGVLNLLETCKTPLVVDADALNCLALNLDKTWKFPPQTIITPHPKEFDRLAGQSDTSFERLQKAIVFAHEKSCIVVLKGAHTATILPDGNVWFNSTGNPGMATAGSGDVLTGIILAQLCQGFSPENAAVFAVYLHGLAGNIAANQKGCESMIASDIIDYMGEAYKKILRYE